MVNSVLEQDAPSAPAANANGLMVISYLQLRFFIGVIGVLLPWVLVIGNWAVGQGLEPSLSGYYYTPMRNIFVGALCGLAVFFIAYHGYDRSDSVITNIAGVATIAVALCPTTTPNSPDLRQVIIGDLHLFFACVAFVLLAVMALRFAKREPTPPALSFWKAVGYAFGFTRAASSQTPRWEVITYRFCGFTILACVALIYPGSRVYSYSLLILETILMTAFGLSWFIKGGKLFAGR
jgi:uncharacterized membrane protein YozB (DUF420 family)